MRSLRKIVADHRLHNLIRDVSDLNVLETLFPSNELRKEEEVELPSDAIKVKCLICGSKEFLVESFGHYKILVCERPNCVYERALRTRNKIKITSEDEV